MNYDSMLFIDWTTFQFLTNGFFKWTSNDNPGERWHTERDEKKGLTYISDHVTEGDLICKAPYKNGIMTGLPHPVLSTAKSVAKV